MPIPATLEQQFSSLSTADAAELKDGATAPLAAVVSPTKSINSAFSDESSQGSTESPTMLASKTEHKLKEEQGLMAEEPLLKANPHRFVIFPIQDNDVS